MVKDIKLYLTQESLFELIKENLGLKEADIKVIRPNSEHQLFEATNIKRINDLYIKERYTLNEAEVEDIINLKLLETPYEVESFRYKYNDRSDIVIYLKEKEQVVENENNNVSCNEKVKKKGSIKNV